MIADETPSPSLKSSTSNVTEDEIKSPVIDAYKRYKELSQVEKVRQLVTQEDLDQIKQDFR